MAEKVCDHHKNRQRKSLQRCCGAFLIILFICLFIFLLTWAILQPRKPRFILQDATIFNFNVSAPNLLSSQMQVTVFARNPNRRIGIYYDNLDIYATYHSQQITYYTVIPAAYQGHKDNNVWSPFVYGNNVPIAPYNGPALTSDQTSGSVWLTIKIDGRVKWKVGSIITGRYHLHVTCPAYIPFGNKNNNGLFAGTAVKFQLQQKCRVSL
ncbi:hypothetical protein Leryth_008835 [Lithospermum erythrorhizon]|nr:hypothetical protein Leryth_008835 [Lithospermum erythrorhizon]